MKTNLLSIALIGVFAIAFISLPSCKKDSNDLAMTDVKQSDDLKKNLNTRPFKGSIEYVVDPTITLTCDCNDPFFIGNYFSGTGNITHMGKIYAESVPCIEYIFQGTNVIGYNISSQCDILVAANGDEVFMEADPYTMNLDFECFCNFSGETTVHFNGGTGRFENASGSATVSVLNDLGADLVIATFDGEISY